MAPHCIDCAYEIDPALGRIARCPECGREYDLARRESYGPVEAELAKVSWRSTLLVVLAGCAIGGAAMLIFEPVLVLGVCVAIGLGVLAECRRLWGRMLAVLGSLHVLVFLLIFSWDPQTGLTYLFGAPGIMMVPLSIGLLAGRACALLLAPRPS